MKRYLKIILPIVLVVAIIITLIAVIGNPNNTLPAIQEVPKEEIFTKTIHDFAGYQIEQLTDEEDANFVVFAEGVKEIVVSKDTNILVETNYKKLSYTFRNADESLKSLKKDDVIYGRVSQWNPEGVAAKVKKIKISGDTVTVFSQPIGLADMFVYADVCMEASLANAFFDTEQLEEGSQITINNQPGANARSGGLGSSSQSNGTETNMDDSETQSGLQSVSKDVKLTFAHSLNIKKETANASGSVSIPTKKPITIDGSASRGVEVTGTLSTSLDSVTVEWRFDRETLQFYCGVWADISADDFVQASAYGQADAKYAFPTVTIPVNLILSMKIETCITAEVSGSISGSVHRTQTNRYGVKAAASAAGVKMEPINTVVKPSKWDGSLGEMEAELSVGFELKPSIQFGFIGSFYVSGWGGLTFSGSYDPKEFAPQEKKPDYIHDCDACIDGDIDLGGKIDAGIEVKLASNLEDFNLSETLQDFLKKEKDGLEQLQPSITILEVSKQVGDFYISTAAEKLEQGYGADKTTFGFGECPNYRYKTTVNLVDEEGKAVGGAAVTADLGNGKTEEVVADEKGVATIYLPRGEASINASQKTQFAETTLDVQQASTIQLQLENNGFYIVELNIASSTDEMKQEIGDQQYQKLRKMLSQKYPNAIFYNELSPEEKEKNPMEVGSLALTLLYAVYPDDYSYAPLDRVETNLYITLLEVTKPESPQFYDRYSWMLEYESGSFMYNRVYANADPISNLDQKLFDHEWKYQDADFYYNDEPDEYEDRRVPLDTAIQRGDQAVSRIFPFIDLHLKGKWNYDNLQVLFDKLP